MTDMVERVARAIQKADFEDSGLPWDSINPEGQSDYRKYARAAIEAMQEPTAEMVKAGTISWDPMDGGPIRPMFEPTKPYQAMIRAAMR